MFAEQFANVRAKSPLIHNITNYVTVNDCANMVLACGASPIMADDAAEVEDITTICGGLNINIGTLNSRTIESMLKAGKKANALGHPVVLDPVGAGASALRTGTACRLLDEVRFTVIRGNISEVKTLASGAGTTKGVDADVADRVTEENLDGAVAFAKAFAAKTGAVVAITGAIDIVADGSKAYCIRNGHPMMSAITGTGCQLSALTAAFITAYGRTPDLHNKEERVYYESPYPTLYMSGNVMEGNRAISRSNYDGVRYAKTGGEKGELLDTPMPVNGLVEGHTTTHEAKRACALVLAWAGASHARDAVDDRIVRDVRAGTAAVTDGGRGSTGGLVDTQRAVGGWPEYRQSPAPEDSDGDGIPDVWERQRGLDPADAADGAKIDPASGYTWLECYLNSLVGSITDRQNNQEKS